MRTVKKMSNTTKHPRPGLATKKLSTPEPTTPRARTNSHLAVPLLSPIPGHRFSPALEEFSLRQTPSRGGTASPAPPKGVRKRLHQHRNVDHAVGLLKQSKNIVVLTGAGISTSVGIPDFRSDKGLYSQLSKDLGITEAEEFFSRDYFIQNTEQFLHYVRRVIPEAVLNSDGYFRSVNPAKPSKDGRTCVPEFSLTHAFLAMLCSKQKLRTNYTQNIDGLEIAAGVPRQKLIQCHGSWDTASCMTCGRTSTAKKYLPIVFAGNVPFCKCKLEKGIRKKKLKNASRKRSWDDFDSDHSSDDGTQAPRGLMKPDITFFNERLSGSYGDRLDDDKSKIDLLIIIGTSLKVGPVQDMLYQISPKVPQIFISKERFSGALCNLPGVQVDIELLGECDAIIEEMCRRAGWLQELEACCWHDDQMRIKEFGSKVSIAHSKEIVTDKCRPRDLIEERSDGDGPRKRLKREESHDAKTLSNPNNQKQDANSTIETMSLKVENLANPRSNSHSDYNLDNNAVTKDEADLKDSQEKSMVEAARKENRTEPGLQRPSKTSNTETRVKIELVEGTTHQWRVSRK